MNFTNLIGIASVIATLIFRIVPILGIINVFKTRDIRQIPFLIYFTCTLSTTFFTMYGIQIHDIDIILINISAVIIMPIYLTLYIYFLPGAGNLLRSLLFLLLYGFCCSILIVSYILPKDLNGTIASTLSFLLQGSQILTVIQVIIYNNSIYIDIYLIWAFALTNFLNTIYGFLLHKVYLWISMVFGLFWNVTQMAMYLKYPRNEFVEEANDEDFETQEGPFATIKDITHINNSHNFSGKNSRRKNSSTKEEEEDLINSKG